MGLLVQFDFYFGQKVRIKESGIAGVICGRVEYSDFSKLYAVDTMNSDFNLISVWFDQSEIEIFEEKKIKLVVDNKGGEINEN